MNRILLLFLFVLFVTDCRAPADKKSIIMDEDLVIRRAAVFLFIMNNDGTWGERELAAEIEYLKYLLSQEGPNGR